MTIRRLRLRRISHINLRVRDVDESADFYCGLFGLQQREADPPSESVRLCMAASGSKRAQFGLVLCRGLPATGEPGGLDHFSFEVPAAADVDDVYRRARQWGAPATKPRFYGGGWQTFVFDPDGYKIEVRATAHDRATNHQAAVLRSLLPLLLAAPLALLQPARGFYPALAVSRLAADSPAVVTDTGGPIEQVVVHFDPELEPELSPVYTDLFNELPGNIQIQVVCPSQDAADTFILHWGAQAAADNRELQVVNVDAIISVWARDRRIARQYLSSNAPAPPLVPVNLPEYDEDRHNELGLPARLQGLGLVAGVAPLPLVLEGGNVLSNSKHAFIGANALSANADLATGEQHLETLLTQGLGRRPINVCDRFGGVPWDHLDMYVTPIDDETIFVASTRDGAALLSHDDEADLLAVIDDSERLAGTFDDIAAGLAAYGYAVARLPALVDRSRAWMVTYTNVLMEHGPHGRVVYMPTYDLPELDDAADRMFREHGFDVRSIDVSEIFRLGGAARCLVNVTRRRTAEEDPRLPGGAGPPGPIRRFALTAGGLGGRYR